MKKSLVLILAVAFFAINFQIDVFGQEFRVDGINYKVTSTDPATVGVGWHISYSGTANIPEIVANESITYSVTSIGGAAFEKCYRLTSVIIPNTVTSIEESAFYECSGLTSVNIPKTVTSIGTYAFLGCSGLTSVTVNWYTPLTVKAGVFAFANVTDITLYVPAGTEAAYKAAPVWKEFKIQAITSVNDYNFNDTKLQLYPNPVSNTFKLITDDEFEGSFTYQIVDVTGRIVAEGSSLYNEPISIENLVKGNYIVQVKTEQGKESSVNLIKN